MADPKERKPVPNPLPDEERRTERGGAGMAGVGIQFALTVVFCAFVGNWIDRKAGSAPWGVVGGSILGFAAGLYALLRAAKSENRKLDRNGDSR